ncbi:nuclear transport factor 2 family protein [Amycolatopsis sp. lyj-112]|uniref:nuclear transport factor 2 family protein n=1 Tax=Amycolatopsis sp. lyj-112 TaxID=2789288 RepID=UPI00397B5E3D
MTTISTTAATTIAHRFAEAFNTRDVEKVIGIFTPDATYHDLFYGAFSEHDGLRKLFGRMYSEGVHHEWTMRAAVAGESRTVGEWDFAFTLSDRVRHGAGRTLRFRGVSVFETREGHCHTYREYFDRTAALFAIGITPGAVSRIVRHRPSVLMTLPESGTLAR